MRNATALRSRANRPLVAIVDPYSSGHHPMYAQGYLQALLKIGCEVMVIAPPELLETLPSSACLEQRVTLVPWKALEDRKPLKDAETHAERLWQSLGQALSTAEISDQGRYPDVVFLLYLDAFITDRLPASVIADHVACPVAGLWFKPPRSGRLGWRERVQRLTRLGRRYRLLHAPLFFALLLLDGEAARAVPGRRRLRIINAPEFTDTSLPKVSPPVVRTILQRASGRRVCCMVGSIDRRKGVQGFLKAAAAAPPTEWFFVIAGRVAWHTFNDETRAVLREAVSSVGEGILLIDEWFPAETLNAIVQASDLLYACYEDWPYSSNMPCKAAALGTPVIGPAEGYIGRNLRLYDLGFVLPRARCLESLFAPGFGDIVSEYRISDAFKAGCRRYLAANDHDSLVAVLDSLVGELAPR